MGLSREEISQIALKAAEEVIKRAHGVTFNPHTPSGVLSDPPAVKLVGIARRPPTPEQALEWEEEKMEEKGIEL